MKKLLKLVLIICLTILITACSNPPRNFVALGDSVADGFGLSSQEESYPALLFNMLENEGFVDNYSNLAVSGFTSTMLLEYLNNIEKDELKKLKKAQIVTLNIGGNNVLVPFIEHISNLQITAGVENVKSGAEGVASGTRDFFSGIVSGVRSIFNDQEVDTSAIEKVKSGFDDLLAGLGNILTGTGEIITGYLDLLDIFFGSFSPELKDELEKGIQAFSEEFNEIITWIEKKAPKATIIVNTIYNPVPQEVLNTSVEISIIANLLVETMNGIIINESKSGRYLVTDVYTNLSEQLDMMLFNINPFFGDLSFDVVHPNTEGHRLIAELNYETFKQGK